MIVSSTSVQNPPDHHRWRELFGGDSISMWKLLFFDMALYSPAQLAFIVHLIVANSTNLSRMNSAGCRRQSCSNKFDLTQCDQCKAARKQTKKSLSLATDLSEIDAAAISLLASRMSNRVQSSESAALFCPAAFVYVSPSHLLLPPSSTQTPRTLFASLL
uniref:(northern house mosquito) hypothetical protein n=2 Tax=Culex pipiens TaxID=7175 RepID=A0A8D8ICH7_CULPI